MSSEVQGDHLKKDFGKIRLDLLPFEALEDVARVLEFGAKKYHVDAWREGMAWRRLLAACLRHLFAWSRGQNLDPETGLSHLAHAACCLLFLISYKRTGAGVDDRYTEPPAELPSPNFREG